MEMSLVHGSNGDYIITEKDNLDSPAFNIPIMSSRSVPIPVLLGREREHTRKFILFEIQHIIECLKELGCYNEEKNPVFLRVYDLFYDTGNNSVRSITDEIGEPLRDPSLPQTIKYLLQILSQLSLLHAKNLVYKYIGDLSFFTNPNGELQILPLPRSCVPDIAYRLGIIDRADFKSDIWSVASAIADATIKFSRKDTLHKLRSAYYTMYEYVYKKTKDPSYSEFMARALCVFPQVRPTAEQGIEILNGKNGVSLNIPSIEEVNNNIFTLNNYLREHKEYPFIDKKEITIRDIVDFDYINVYHIATNINDWKCTEKLAEIPNAKLQRFLALLQSSGIPEEIAGTISEFSG